MRQARVFPVPYRADFSFWLGATSRRAVHARFSIWRRMNDEHDDGQTASRILTAGRRRNACGVAGPSRLDARRRRTAGPACSLCRRHGAENGGSNWLRSRSRSPRRALPSVFSGLTFEQYAAIRRVPGTAIWSDRETGLFPRAAASGLRLHDSDRDQHCRKRHVAEGDLRRGQFRLRPVEASGSLGDLGFSGLRILKSSDQGFEDVAIFQGATFYRARAHAQPFGLTARGLAIRTGDEPGEEFPLFREFWIEKPNPAANTLTIHALLDSASVTGAVRFTLRPSEITIIDTEMTLIARTAVDKLGFGAMAAAHLFSPLDHRRPDDVRAAAYESTGLQILTGRRRVALAPGLQSGDLADLGLFRRQPARLRAFAAQPLVRRVLRRRDALGIEAVAVDRADRRLGAGRPPSPGNPGRLGGQRERHRPMAPQDRHGRGHHPVDGVPAVLVLVAAIPAAARVLRVVATRQGRRPSALRGRDGWATCSPTRRKLRRRARTFKRPRARSSPSGFLPIKTGVRCASFSILTRDRKPIQSCV